MWTFLIAIAIGVGIFGVALRTVRLLATPPPDDPDPNEIMDVEVAYRCTVCGLRLIVTHAQEADVVAPKHCREEMVEA